MPLFQFQAIQVLNLTEADHPSLKKEGSSLVIAATRGGEQIVITLPASVSDQTQMIPETKTPKKFFRKAVRTNVKVPPARRGEQHPHARLTEGDVREMRAMAQDKSYVSQFDSLHAMYMDIAKVYKIHFTTAYKIIRNQSWKHVTNG